MVVDLSKLPPMLAATIAEVVPQLVGGRDTVHLARKLIEHLIAYANDWGRLPATEVINLTLPAHFGLVALAREQPWKLRAAVQIEWAPRLSGPMSYWRSPKSFSMRTRRRRRLR